jgi:hypothetical protein
VERSLSPFPEGHRLTHSFISKAAAAAASFQHALSFLSSAMANNNPPPQLPQLPPLPLPWGTFAEGNRHPSRGGNPYSDNFRNNVIMRYQLGLGLDTNELNALRAVYAYPSISSCA